MGTNVLRRPDTGAGTPASSAKGWKKLDLSELFSREFRIGKNGIYCAALEEQIAGSEKSAGSE
ncbi:hypothetical protein NUH88_20260 [Nisaea acidiphila]|uniref:Uncharacterized protein n=1 Tax=Nisaea acidiphila TaxID=1862145 RepID=A0A9J7AR50_9PROT|nr:hypothetical protein [Nisaea acidiphila]UUX49719.1 hypothetical protein NUH88_20260 [Nisaea acidiphila]